MSNKPHWCEYSNLFFSGLRTMALDLRDEPPYATGGPSSPIDLESALLYGVKGRKKTTSVPYRNLHRKTFSSFSESAQPLDRPVRRPSGPRSTESRHYDTPDGQGGYASDDSTTPDSYLLSDVDPPACSPRSKQRASPSSGSSRPQLTEALFPVKHPESFLSFAASPTASPVSPTQRRERHASVQTMPLHAERRSSINRRSIVSVDFAYAVMGSGKRGPLSGGDVGGWGDDVPGDWRRIMDDLSRDDPSFLIIQE
ncbi:hypothetical protein AcV7_006845 [Taiwanofungus camphoratus]|nr:hypothetical protein AcV7_006845 [Antrodia cinnamomea]